MEYQIYSGEKTQSIGLVLEPNCPDSIEIASRIKVLSIESSGLSDDQVQAAIHLDERNLQFVVQTDDFVTYLGKSATVQIGLEADPDLQVNRHMLFEVIFTAPKPAFDLKEYPVQSFQCGEEAATWSMTLPQIINDDIARVIVELLKPKTE